MVRASTEEYDNAFMFCSKENPHRSVLPLLSFHNVLKIDQISVQSLLTYNYTSASMIGSF